MKYKVTANQTIMAEGISCLKAMNLVINMLQSYDETQLDVKVYYLSGTSWKLENSFRLGNKH